MNNAVNYNILALCAGMRINKMTRQIVFSRYIVARDREST